jgi:hypothetical protein
MIIIDLTQVVLERLRNRGWKENMGYTLKNNPRVLKKDGKRIAVVGALRLKGSSGIADQVDTFFVKMEKILTKHNDIKEVHIQGGGRIPVPPSFIEFCKANGIKISFFDHENIDRYFI